MASQVQRRSVLFVVLFLWTSVLTGNCLNPEQIQRATDHIKNTITKIFDKQYAYVVTFSEEQCTHLTAEDITNALEQDVNKASDIQKMVTNSEIYIGSNLVIASYKDVTVSRKKTIRRHAERRLLSPEGSNPEIPVETLLKSNPGAGCMIFYTLFSPCTKACTNLEVDYNIINKFDLFKSVKDNSFVFGSVYFSEKNKEAVWESFEKLDNRMPLYRCSQDSCFKCFVKQNNQITMNENCFAYK